MELLHLEQQRQALEQNMEKLRSSLRYYQALDAEYESLKEGLQAFDGEIDASVISEIANDYGGDVVNEKEMRELAGLDKDSPRTPEQIINLVGRRQDYVQKNIETIQRQFFDAEAKQEELAFVAASQGAASEGGLPLTEIHEELDEDGNVISSHLSQPEEATAKAIESLRKAGVRASDLDGSPKPKSTEELKPAKPAIVNASPPITPPLSSNVLEGGQSTDATSSPADDGFHHHGDRPTIRKKSVSFTADTKVEPERPRSVSRDGKKSVSFNDKISVMPAAPPPDTRTVSFAPQVEEIPAESPIVPPSKAQPLSSEEVAKGKDLMEVADTATDGAETGVEAAKEVVLPEDESPEDARLRREMLDYHLNEVGNVVAHMDLDPDDMDYYDDEDDDDNSSYHTTSEYLEDDDTPYTTGLSESEDSEDELGRSKHRQITPEYRKQMEELQQRLIGNLGPAPEAGDLANANLDLDPNDVRRLVIRDKRGSMSSVGSDSSEKKPGTKKRVSFAEELDVAGPGSPPLKAQKVKEGENVTPITEKVPERSTAASPSTEAPTPKQKTSRFKQTRNPPSTSTPDQHLSANTSQPKAEVSTTPLSTTLVERPTGQKASAPSLEKPDSITQRRELAEAYYSRRNDMIRQQGGFKVDRDEDEEMGQLMEETPDGRVRKVSKFKAARLKGM